MRLTDADRHYRLCPQPADFAAIDRHLGGNVSGHTWVGLHLGSGRTAVHGWKFWYPARDRDPRIWPIERYIALAGALCAANPRVRVVITGTPNERFLGRRFTRRVPGVVNLVGRTSLLQLAALMSRLAAFVTHDNGSLHVACAAGAPLVGLFGPTEPQCTGPFPRRPEDVIVKAMRMEDIAPQDVCRAVLEQISRGSSQTATPSAAVSP